MSNFRTRKQTDLCLSLDDCHLANPVANSHPGRHRALLSKPGKLLWFSRQHRVSNDVLSGEPPLEWLRAMFVGVVQMHQSHRWTEWTPAATVQHSNYLSQLVTKFTQKKKNWCRKIYFLFRNDLNLLFQRNDMSSVTKRQKVTRADGDKTPPCCFAKNWSLLFISEGVIFGGLFLFC